MEYSRQSTAWFRIGMAGILGPGLLVQWMGMTTVAPSFLLNIF